VLGISSHAEMSHDEIQGIAALYRGEWLAWRGKNLT